MLLFAAAFLSCALFQVLLHPIANYFQFFSQNYCSILTILWAVSIERRIIDRRQRRLLLTLSFLLLLYYSLQIARYRMFDDVLICRYLWYGYYIPSIMAPVILFGEGLAVYRPEREPLPKIFRFSAGAGLLLLLLFLTNDLHQLCFHFHDLQNSSDYSYGPVTYLYYFYVGSLFLATFLILMKKASWGNVGRSRFLPLFVVLLYATFSILNVVGMLPRYKGGKLWNVGEVFGFTMAAFVESFIQMGLIPSNSGYEKLFPFASPGARILDRDGRVIFSSTAFSPSREYGGDQIKHMEHEINGGRVCWETDVSGIRQKEQELKELTEQLRSRINYIKEDQQMQEEKIRLDAQNQLYDRISGIVQPQLTKIDELLEEHESTGANKLPEIAVLTTFVKRRSNMELAAEQGMLSSDELAMAVYELLENLKLCHVSAALNAVGKEIYPLPMITGTYEYLEEILENCLDSLESILVTVTCCPENLLLRIMLKAEAVSLKPVSETSELSGFSPKLTVSKENDELLLTLSLQTGGM